MKISLDLPGYEEYLPTYWPGQNITGQVELQVNSAIKVSNLRIALFGNVQVYGKYPGHPMTNGLFDYERNEQLINAGLRIVKRSNANNIDLSSSLTADIPFTPTPQYEPPISAQNSGSPAANYSQQQQEEEEKRKKTRNKKQKSKKSLEDRQIERLIRRIAHINHTTNISHGVLDESSSMRLPCSLNESSSTPSYFTLSANTYQIRFSIPVPTARRLSGTFDHPHYPVSYRIVAVLKCSAEKSDQQQLSEQEITCYSTVRIRLETYLDADSPSLLSSLQTKPTYQFVQNGHSILQNLCNYVLPSSLLSHWAQKKLQLASTNNRVNPCERSSDASCLETYLVMSRQGYSRSSYISFELKLKNHASSHFKISAVKIYIELIRRINMTCSMNEEVEATTIRSTTVLFQGIEDKSQVSDEIVENDDHPYFFEHANMRFDLSKLIKIPDDCVCSIPSELVKDVFSLGYDLNVRLHVTGISNAVDAEETITRNFSLEEDDGSERSYQAIRKHQLLQDSNGRVVSEEPLPHQNYKTYILYLDPLPVIIGNAGYVTSSAIHA
ncbi:MAG: hypothetical protein EXX96DRAFT_475132 [Benjaminiella poitrasii]|nr:MAG: hypothetical protein EXX96DRAFT_475132 [Benjaminiella poitrasii]